MLTVSTPRTRLPRGRSVLLATVLGWILPGLGQVYAGRPWKGLLFLVAILPTFLLGWKLTDLTVIDPGRYPLDMVAQAMLGLPTAIALHVSEGRVLEHLPRFFDVGRLYVQVAGLLNLVAVCDAIGEVIRRNRQVDAMRAVHAARAAEAAALPPAGPPPLPDTVPEATPEAAVEPETPRPSPPREVPPDPQRWWEDDA